MGGFPQLPSGNNSALGAAAGAAGAATRVYDTLQSRLQQAAQNKAAAARKDREDTAAAVQREYADQFQLNKEGAVQTNLPRMGDAPLVDAWGPRPTLQHEESNPAAPTDGKGQTITTPGGTKYYMPTAQEKAAALLDDSNSIVAPAGSDAENLLQGLGIKPGTRVSNAHLGALTALQKQMQATADAAEKKNQVGIVTQEAADKAAKLGITIPVDTRVPIGQLKEFMEALTPKEKAEEIQTAIPGYAGPTGAPLVRGDKSGKVQELQLPPGSKPALTEAQRVADADRHARMAEVGENAAARKDAASQRVQNELASHNNKLGDRKETAKKDFLRAVKDAAGEDDPDAARKEAAQTYKQDLQRAQSEYETNIGTTMGKPIDHNPWADQIDPATLPGVAPKQPKGADAKTVQRAGEQTVQTSKYKVGETRTHQGQTYRFDGGQWVQQGAPKAAAPAPAKAVPKVGETRTYNGANYKFDGRQWVNAGAAANATR